MDFVTFEIAKKLKDKDFVCKYPFAMYNENGIFHALFTSADYYTCESGKKYREYYGFEDFDEHDYICPTISQVLKWLREEKGIDIMIELIITYNDNFERIREYSCRIFTSKLNKPKTTDCFKSFEEAAIAGIDYVIDNLI